MTAALLAGGLVDGVAQAAPNRPLPSADPFYRYDGPLANKKPGAVLRTRNVPFGYDGTAAPISSTQVLYRSTNQQGEPITTVATVLRSPTRTGPPKLLSYHMAYDALGSQCDPSYTLTGAGKQGTAGTLEQAVISGYLASGYDVVVPDYEGQELEWTVGRQSGYMALDGIRAAERVLRYPASTPVALAGYSGGSVPTEWGAAVAPRYAPELRIVGAAAGGLPVNLAHNLPYVSGSKDWSGVIPALIVAYQRAYGLNTASFLSAKGKRIVNQVKNKCIIDFADKYPGLTDASMVRAPYTSLLDVPSVSAAIADNVMGTGGTPRVPVLLAVGNADGKGDGVMVTRDVAGLARKYCGRGVPVTYAQYNGMSHSEAFMPFQADTARFLTERFAGAPKTSTC